jgi:nitrate reductase NapD
MNVSSIAVKTESGHLNDVVDKINQVDLCEVHFHDSDGKIVVTIEGESISDQMEKLKIIQGIPFVFSANLSYSYCEDELTQALKQMNQHQSPGHD